MALRNTNSTANQVDPGTLPRSTSVVSNWSVLTITGLASQALNMLAMLRIARILQPQGFGEYNLVLAVAGVAFVFGGLGLRQVLMRECARNGILAMSLLRRAILGRTIAGVIVGAATIIYARHIPDPLVGGLQVAILLLLPAQLLWDSIESILFGLQRMILPSIINITSSFLWVVLIWVTPSGLFSSVMVSISFALMQVGKSITLWSWWLQRESRSEKTTVSQLVEAGALFKISLPFYWLAIMTAVSNLIPVLLLGIRSKQLEIGLFNAPWRVLAPLQLLLNTGMVALYPLLSKQSSTDQIGFTWSVRKAAVVIVVLGSCAALCASLFRRELVSVLFGSAFIQSGDVLMYQCWLTLFSGAYYLIGVVLSARDRQHSLAILSTIYAVVTVSFVWFGSAYGAVGLALGMLISAFVNFPYHWVVFQRTLPMKLLSRETTLLLLFTLAFALPAYAIPSESLLILRLGVAAVALILATIVLMRFSRAIPGKSQVGPAIMPKAE